MLRFPLFFLLFMALISSSFSLSAQAEEAPVPEGSLDANSEAVTPKAINAQGTYSFQVSKPSAASLQATPKIQVASKFTPIKVKTTSVKLPKGTLLKIHFSSTLDSRQTQQGEALLATLTDDLMAPTGLLVLPRGTTLRGRVLSVTRSRWFSRGGAITLGFDHVVLSNGLQVSVPLRLSLSNKHISPNGAFYADPGILNKVAANWDDSANTIAQTTRKGMEAGKKLGPAGPILTTPIAAAGGAIAGTTTFAAKSVVSAFAPGKPVRIEPKDAILIELVEETTFPAES
jgi:hypothetical protein